MKKRIDVFLHEKGIFDSRAKAAEAVARGYVLVNGDVCTKSSKQVDENDDIFAKQLDYVSRAAEKLLHAIKVFGINASGKVAMDVGASTGGFSQVLLQQGAKQVFAVDTGEGQLAMQLKNDPCVVDMQKTNFLDVENGLVKKMDIIVSDVSFVSLTKLAHKFAQGNCPVVVLIKPQFECGKTYAKKHKGVVKDAKMHVFAIESVVDAFKECDLFLQDLDVSPIKGGDGNIEFLAFFSKNMSQNVIDIKKIVEKAHMML